MKFASVAALAYIGFVQGQEEWDDDYLRDHGDDFEDWDDEPKEYGDGEKEKQEWIYGKEGDPDYNPELSGEEIRIREEMWGIDLQVQKNRGTFQGWHRGFYKDYDWDIGEHCFGRTSVVQIYWIQHILDNFSWSELVNLHGLIFNLYFMFDHQCEID